MIKEKDKAQRKSKFNSRKGWKISLEFLWSERNVALSYFETVCTHKHQKQASH
jgi:hypothetical protein